jgi:hypothetical protein
MMHLKTKNAKNKKFNKKKKTGTHFAYICCDIAEFFEKNKQFKNLVVAIFIYEFLLLTPFLHQRRGFFIFIIIIIFFFYYYFFIIIIFYVFLFVVIL